MRRDHYCLLLPNPRQAVECTDAIFMSLVWHCWILNLLPPRAWSETSLRTVDAVIRNPNAIWDVMLQGPVATGYSYTTVCMCISFKKKIKHLSFPFFQIMEFYERASGARMHAAYVRPGGVSLVCKILGLTDSFVLYIFLEKFYSVNKKEVHLSVH